MNRVTTRRFDISGSEVPRVAKHALISLFAKYEDFSGGPGFRDLFTALVVHLFGGFLAWLFVRYEHRSVWLFTFLKKHMPER